TRSFASWSNFLGMFQIFPSTQTEQNLGHFKVCWRKTGLNPPPTALKAASTPRSKGLTPGK
ncbi:hypothetical protein, partial [Corynebacterium jeikeium]|uniref:hypothetical protein n=1 Tax=Corynebacterium jeikeium TaxID=38289 RepID=UPI001ED9C260